MNKKMKSKQRVLAVVNHQQPDRVPIDYASNPGIVSRLKEHFGLNDEDSEGLLKALEVNFRHITAPYVGKALHSNVKD